jgi:hypothetical protein
MNTSEKTHIFSQETNKHTLLITETHYDSFGLFRMGHIRCANATQVLLEVGEDEKQIE